MSSWMARPRAFPNACWRCSKNDELNGPYLECDSPPIYYDWRTQKPGRQYWCRECLQAVLLLEGSPVARIVEDLLAVKIEPLLLEIEELKKAADPVQAMVQEVQRQVGRAKQQRGKGVRVVEQEPVA